jgi:hypothetical protein
VKTVNATAMAQKGLIILCCWHLRDMNFFGGT